MAHIICPNCGNLIPDNSPVCPKCGLNNPLNHTFDDVSPTEKSNSAQADRQPLPYPKKTYFTPYDTDNDNDSRDGRGKSNHVVLIWIIIFLLAGCGVGTYFYLSRNNERKQSDRNRQEQLRRENIADEDARTDARARVEEEARAEARRQLIRDSLNWFSFTSPDLNLLDIHGHVKSVDYSFSDYKSGPYFIFQFQQNFIFNKQGILSNLTANRNNLDQITNVEKTINEEYFSDDLKMTIEWSGDYPRIIKGFTTYYNETANLDYTNGQLRSINSDFSGDSYTSINHTIDISPETYDRHGNWTRAKVIVTGEEKTIHWSDYYQEEISSINDVYFTYTISREIEYYPFLR